LDHQGPTTRAIIKGHFCMMRLVGQGKKKSPVVNKVAGNQNKSREQNRKDGQALWQARRRHNCLATRRLVAFEEAKTGLGCLLISCRVCLFANS